MQVDMAAAGVIAKPKRVRICVHGEIARDEAPGGAAEVIDRIRRGAEPFSPAPDLAVARPAELRQNRAAEAEIARVAAAESLRAAEAEAARLAEAESLRQAGAARVLAAIRDERLLREQALDGGRRQAVLEVDRRITQLVTDLEGSGSLDLVKSDPDYRGWEQDQALTPAKTEIDHIDDLPAILPQVGAGQMARMQAEFQARAEAVSAGWRNAVAEHDRRIEKLEGVADVTGYGDRFKADPTFAAWDNERARGPFDLDPLDYQRARREILPQMRDELRARDEADGAGRIQLAAEHDRRIRTLAGLANLTGRLAEINADPDYQAWDKAIGTEMKAREQRREIEQAQRQSQNRGISWSQEIEPPGGGRSM